MNVFFNFICVRKFLAGLVLKSKDVYYIKNNKVNLKNYILKIKNKEFKIFNIKNDKNIKLLLNKVEISLILFFLKKKNYKCVVIDIIKINNLYKAKIVLLKKRG